MDIMDRRHSVPAAEPSFDYHCHHIDQHTICTVEAKEPMMVIIEGEPVSSKSDSKTDPVAIADQITVDGGFGWIIAFASFLINLVVDGTAYSFGIFFEAFVQQFAASRAVTALAGSLMVGCYLSAGPLVSSLIQRFDCRPVAICGALISAGSLYASSYATHIYVHLLTYGLCTGFGFGLMYLPAIVSVSVYFERKRAFATGLALCGSGFGAFVYAPFCQWLLQRFGAQRSVQVLAGLVALVGTAAGLAMRPLVSDLECSNRSKVDDVICKTEPASATRTRKVGTVQKSPLVIEVQLQPESGKPQLQVRPDERAGKAEHLLLIPTVKNGRSTGGRTVSECYHNASNRADMDALSSYNECNRRASHGKINRSAFLSASRGSLLLKKDIFYSGSVNRIDYGSVETIERTSRPSLDAHNDASQMKPSDTPQCDSIVRQMLDLSLFVESKSFRMLAISNLLAMMAFYVPFVYLTQHVQRNIQDENRNPVMPNQAALLLSYVGVTNTFGRMLFGWISDQLQKANAEKKAKWNVLNALGINNLCLLWAGLSIALLPLLTTYVQIAINCLVFGLCCAAYMCLTSIILVDLLGLPRLTNAFGLISMCRGVGSLVGPPIAGLLYDWTESYQATFATAGLLFIVSALFSLSAASIKMKL